MEHRREICFLRIRPLVGPAPPPGLGGLRGLYPVIRSPDSQTSCGFLAVLSRKQAETRMQSPREQRHLPKAVCSRGLGFITPKPGLDSRWSPACSLSLGIICPAPVCPGHTRRGWGWVGGRGWASGLRRWDVGPRASGGGLDLSLCTSRSEEAVERLPSPGTICPEDMTGEEARGGGGECGGWENGEAGLPRRG